MHFSSFKKPKHTHDMFLASKIKNNPRDISGISPNDTNSFLTFVVNSARCSKSVTRKISILKSGLNYSTLN